jgi:hypothetical protein
MYWRDILLITGLRWCCWLCEVLYQYINTHMDQHIINTSSAHQHINTMSSIQCHTSTHQHINTSTHQHVNTSTHQHININTSTQCHINTSTQSSTQSSTHHINTSTQSSTQCYDTVIDINFPYHDFKWWLCVLECFVSEWGKDTNSTEKTFSK